MNGARRWQDTPDWQPTSARYECACGCGETVTFKGIGRRPQYVSAAHRMRHKRRQPPK